jgi:hypothetical protein
MRLNEVAPDDMTSQLDDMERQRATAQNEMEMSQAALTADIMQALEPLVAGHARLVARGLTVAVGDEVEWAWTGPTQRKREPLTDITMTMCLPLTIENDPREAELVGRVFNNGAARAMADVPGTLQTDITLPDLSDNEGSSVLEANLRLTLPRRPGITIQAGRIAVMRAVNAITKRLTT